MKKNNKEDKTIGQIIKELRLERKMTQETFAEKVGVTNKSVSKWEQDYSKPDIEMIKNICKVFGVSLNLLIKNKHTFKDKIHIIFERFSKLFNYSLKNVFLLIFCIAFIYFLLFYINNVDTDQIYRLSITSDNILMQDGGFVHNKVRNILYIKFLPLKTEFQPQNIIVELYAYVRGEKFTIYKGYDFNNIIIDNSNRYPNILQYDVIDAMLNNMFLEIKAYDDTGTEHIYTGVISSTKIYSNNQLFHQGKSAETNEDVTLSNSFNNSNELLAATNINQKLIDMGYRYEKNNECYTKKNHSVTISYYSKTNTIIYDKENSDNNTKAKMLSDSRRINIEKYTNDSKNIYKIKYHFDTGKIECITGNCENYTKDLDEIITYYNQINNAL